MKTGFTFNDAGANRNDYGHCVARSIAIATRKPFAEVYAELGELVRKRYSRKRKRKTNAGYGVPPHITRAYMEELGWSWVPTMGIGTGCKVHMRRDELPAGRLVVRLTAHVSAVIDGVEHSTTDSSRDGTRCVYGYWIEPEREPLDPDRDWNNYEP